MAEYRLNFPIETAEAYAFWESRHKLNRIKAIIAFSLDLDNANDNLRRRGYYRQYRKRYLELYKDLVNDPSMQSPQFELSGPDDLWWDPKTPPAAIGPMVMVQDNVDKTYAVGAPVTFTVRVRGGMAQPLKYQWYWENATGHLDISDGSTVIGSTSGSKTDTFTLIPTSAVAGRKIYCIISDGTSTLTSYKSVLTVAPTLNWNPRPPTTATKTTTPGTKISGTVTGGVPPYKMELSFGGVNIDPNVDEDPSADGVTVDMSNPLLQTGNMRWRVSDSINQQSNIFVAISNPVVISHDIAIFPSTGDENKTSAITSTGDTQTISLKVGETYTGITQRVATDGSAIGGTGLGCTITPVSSDTVASYVYDGGNNFVATAKAVGTVNYQIESGDKSAHRTIRIVVTAAPLIWNAHPTTGTIGTDLDFSWTGGTAPFTVVVLNPAGTEHDRATHTSPYTLKTTNQADGEWTVTVEDSSATKQTVIQKVQMAAAAPAPAPVFSSQPGNLISYSEKNGTVHTATQHSVLYTMGSALEIKGAAVDKATAYQWQKQQADQSWADIGGATSIDFTKATSTDTDAGTYRLMAVNGNSAPSYSETVVVVNSRIGISADGGAAATPVVRVDDSHYTQNPPEGANKFLSTWLEIGGSADSGGSAAARIDTATLTAIGLPTGRLPMSAAHVVESDDTVANITQYTPYTALGQMFVTYDKAGSTATIDFEWFGLKSTLTVTVS